MRPASSSSLYVHVPFCVVKCGYCDFNSYEVAAGDEGVMGVFVEALGRELQQTRVPRAPTSVFFGGGTPTYLDDDSFARMFEVVAEHVDLDQVGEVTMEANPESATLAKLRRAREAGVNRVSIGAQSFAAERLQFLDRAHDAEAVRRAVGVAREAGFDNLSLDLMFGLPGQEPAEWESDLEEALALSPDHLSCYNLTFEAGTKLEHARRSGRVEPNDPVVDRSMFLFTRERLGQAGFDAYEVSNFAGRGGPCRHNDHYWLQGDYVGVGPGAASHRAGVRGTNLKPVHAWAEALQRGLPPTGEAETLTPRQRVAEALWLGIRRREGVDLAALARRLGARHVDAARPTIDGLVAAGQVQRNGDRVTLTGEGLLFADSVGEQLLTT